MPRTYVERKSIMMRKKMTRGKFQLYLSESSKWFSIHVVLYIPVLFLCFLPGSHLGFTAFPVVLTPPNPSGVPGPLFLFLPLVVFLLPDHMVFESFTFNISHEHESH